MLRSIRRVAACAATLLLLPGSASALQAGVLAGMTDQKSGDRGRANYTSTAPAVALMVGGAPRSWFSMFGELRVSWYRDEEDVVGSFTHLGLRSFFDISAPGDGQSLKAFSLTLAPGLGLYEMHTGRHTAGLRAAGSSHEDGLYASAMAGLTGWTTQSFAVGLFVEYAALLPFSSCILNELDYTLDCDRGSFGNTHLGLLTYGLLLRF